MLSAMLLGLLAIGAVARDPAPPVRIWLDREDASYMRGDRAKLFLKTRDDGYVVVFHVDPDRRLRVLFPLDPGDDDYVKGGKTYKIINRGGREGFVAEVAGRGVLFAAVSAAPFKFDDFVRNGFWDYNTLNASPIEGDVEQALVELVQRMAGGRFDYDVLGYGAYADASELAPGTDLAYEVEPAFSGCLGCAPVNTVVVSGGVPVYCTSPLYDPLCYDPLYWSPGYVPPSYWNTGWGWYGGYYGDGYPGYYPPSWNRPGMGGGYPGYVPVSPYQPKPWDRQWSGESPIYRPRASIENVNTVVGPLPSTGRILRADPRRTWGGTVPSVVPPPAPGAAPVAGGGAYKPRPQPQGQDDEPSAYTPPKTREQPGAKPQGGKQPTTQAPTPRRSWSDGKPAPSEKPQAAPQPKGSSSSGGGGSRPSQPSSGGGRRPG